jgi:hypothetical protein
MTQEDIIRMAREAGFYTNHGTVFVNGCDIGADMCRFAALVAAAERAACAKVCDAAAKKMDDEGEGSTGYIGWVTDCAAAIRARGNK